MDSITIELTEQELEWCKTHAIEIVEYYGGHGTQGSGTYNHNKISSNLVGVKSELATTKWIRGLLPDANIEENYKRFTEKWLKGDIKLNNKVIEVKGLRPHQWNKFKRMIPPNQLKHCVRNKAIVVWTLATGDTKNSQVKLMGWNYAHEVESHGVEVRTICDNVWLAEDSLMQPMETFTSILD